MFVVSEADAALIRDAFQQRGEISAAVELRRLYPGIGGLANARDCVRMIAAWKPMPLKVSHRERSDKGRRVMPLTQSGPAA